MDVKLWILRERKMLTNQLREINRIDIEKSIVLPLEQ